MAEAPVLQIHQGHALGPFALGASIHDVLARIKSLPLIYPNISLSYAQSHPLSTPIVLNLPHNGLRLRFDGPEQRLRLVEVLDFGKLYLVYKDHAIGKPVDENANPLSPPSTGPTFRQVYKIFGPTTPGEYLSPPNEGDENGTYVLSYPGIAFSFPLQSSVWSASTTWSSTVSLLSSTATGPSTSLSIFSGESWETARGSLFSADLSTMLRSPVSHGLRKEHAPREIETAKVYDQGRIELARRDAPSFWIILGETTPQDLVTELGPPDSIHRKNDRRVSIHRARKNSSAAHSRRGSGNSDMSPPARGPRGILLAEEQSSQEGGSDSDDEDDDDVIVDGKQSDHGSEQVFYNYYSHGFDILISYPTPPSAASPTAHWHRPAYPNSREGSPGQSPPPGSADPVLPRSHLTATKVLFHGNVPGSWAFNRHRRLRWTLESVPSEEYADPLTSEMHWRDIRNQLRQVFADHYPSKEEQRIAALPMVLNRGWGREDVGTDADWGVVGGWEEGGGKARGEGKDGEEREQEKMGAAELYGFPGLVFEVLKNGAVSCLMVY